MVREWRETTTVHDGGRIEVVVPGLSEGDRVEIVVRQNGRPEESAGPRFGSARGRVHIRDDFDEPLDDFREYMR